jgi:hypothetical protein
MSTKLPRVAGGRLYDGTAGGSSVGLDSPRWFAWLEAETTRRFSYELFDPGCGYIVGFMTVGKERRERGGSYWSVFRREGKRVRKIYLGGSQSLTQARLAAVAERLLRGQVESRRTEEQHDGNKAH